MKHVKEDKPAVAPYPRKAFWKSMAAILVMSAVGYGFLWEPGKTLYSPHSDFIAEHVSTKQVLYDSIHQGHGIPLWRSDQYSGYAGLINPQSQFTYPLHFLFYLLPPLAAVGGTFFLHFLASALAYYAVGVALGLSFWPRLMMAAAGLFSFKLIVAVYAGWLPNIPIVVCLPLLFAAVFYLARKPSLVSCLLLAGAGGLCLHTGHLQLFYYSVWFIAVYLVIHSVGQFRQRKAASLGATWLYLAIAAVMAAGLSAYLLLPLAAEAPLVSRSQTVYEFFLGGHAITPRHLLTFLFPEALGTPLDGTYEGGEIWEDAAYFGLIPLLLSGAGAILGWRRKNTKYLAACFAVTVLLSMDSPVLHFLYDYLPGFKLFRIPGRFLFLSTFFGISLAGVGVEQMMERLKGKAVGRKLAPTLAGLAVAIMAAEGVSHAWRYLTMIPQDQAVPDTAYRRYLARDKAVFRVAPIFRPTVNYGWAAPMGLQLVTGYDSFNYRHYYAYSDLLSGEAGRIMLAGKPRARVWCDLNAAGNGSGPPRLTARADMLDALNVKYLISRMPLELPDDHFEQVETFPDQPLFVFYQGFDRAKLYLYRNRHFLPRAFWAHRVVEAHGEDAVITEMQRYDLASAAVVEGKIKDLPAGGDGGPGAVEIRQAGNGRLTVETDSTAGGYLVISEVWHPGWRAKIDGKDAPLYRTDLTLMGLVIPYGSHRLELDFVPLHWSEGKAVSTAASVVFMLAWGGLLVKRRKRFAVLSRAGGAGA